MQHMSEEQVRARVPVVLGSSPEELRPAQWPQSSAQGRRRGLGRLVGVEIGTPVHKSLAHCSSWPQISSPRE